MKPKTPRFAVFDRGADPDEALVREIMDAPEPPEIDPRLVDLAAGQLSPEAESELARDQPDLVLAAFAPLSAGALDRLAAAAQDAYSSPPLGLRGTPAAGRAPPTSGPAWRWPAGAALAALAAGALLAWAGRGPSPRALDQYAPDWQSGDADLRARPADRAPPVPCGAAAERGPAFTHGSELLLRLIPATSGPAPRWVESRVDGAKVALGEVLSTGAVEVRGVVGEPPLALAPGPHCLTVQLGGSWGRRGRTIDLGFRVLAPARPAP